MKVKVFASGSKGNSTIVQCGETSLLIDIGLSFQTMKNHLDNIRLDPKTITAILITHTHNDHIKGLATFIKKTNVKVYIPKEMYEELKSVVPKENIIYLEEVSKIGEIEVELIHTSHDTSCSVGYIITYEERSLVYVTDTGYINRKYLKKMQDKDIYIMESNHDEKMLMEGPYPYYLKQRVIGDKGHLSNHTSATYLSALVSDRTKYIVLAHLSEKNNTEELAREALEEEFAKNSSTRRKIIIARQNEESPYIEV